MHASVSDLACASPHKCISHLTYNARGTAIYGRGSAGEAEPVAMAGVRFRAPRRRAASSPACWVWMREDVRVAWCVQCVARVFLVVSGYGGRLGRNLRRRWRSGLMGLTRQGRVGGGTYLLTDARTTKASMASPVLCREPICHACSFRDRACFVDCFVDEIEGWRRETWRDA